MGIETENSAVVTATLRPEKDDFVHTLMNYRLTMSLLDSMVEQRMITENDWGAMRTIIANRYGLSLDSIYL